MLLAWLLHVFRKMNNAEGFKVEADLRLSWNNGKIIDPVSFRVLQALAVSTCIQDAVKLSGVPYRTAWEHIRNAGRSLGQDLIKSRSGGAQGGGTALTPAGHSILSLFSETHREHSIALASINQRLEQEWNRPLRHLGGFPC